MDSTAWTVIGFGITILVAIEAAFRRLDSRLEVQGREIGQLREPMARLEGLLEGLRDAITKRAA